MQSKQAFPLFIALVSLITFSFSVTAQIDTAVTLKDSLQVDSLKAQDEKEINENDSISRIDSISRNDSILRSDSISRNDSIRSLRISDDAVTSKVNYKARDTIKYNFNEQKVFLYGDAVVSYEDVELKAEYIELKMDSDIVFAIGVEDSNGTVIGSPVFKDGDQEFRSQRITYNFQTEKGKIDEVITQDGEGYVHGEDVKKTGDDVIYIKNGLYTTCEHDDPHFSIWAKQLKVIPDDKIIVKPANLVIEDVNTPVVVPFGIFPNKKTGKSGIIIPMPGEHAVDGFFLQNGGYYFYMGEKAELTIKTDIYTKGSFAVRPEFNYKKRYRYRGNLSGRYKKTVRGVIPEDPTYSVENDYWLLWNHLQEPGARPNSYFSAKVDMGTKNSFKNDLNTSDQDFLRTNFSSQISYKRSFMQKKLNVTLTGRQNQNNGSGNMNITLPEANVSLQRIYPFKSRNVTSDKWYEKVGISYNSNFKNELSLNVDSVAISSENLDTIQNTFRNGFRHTIPVSVNFKVFKNFTLTPSVSYSELWYFESLEKVQDTTDSLPYIKDIMHPGFVRGNNVTTSIGLTTKIFGMMQFRKGYIKAFRHVLTPSIGMSYRPENTQGLTSYTDYSGNEEKEVEYSTFEKGIYGTPDTRKSGKINMSLLNSFEMKVKTKSDTGDGTKKIKLLENFKIGTGYDLVKDSLNWDNLTVSGNSKVSRHFDINMGGTFDLYALRDSAKSQSDHINTFEWDKNGRIGRMTSGNVGLRFRLKGGQGSSKNKSDEDEDQGFTDRDEFNTDEQSTIQREYAQIDWTVPWSLSVNFSLQYKKTVKDYETLDIITTTTSANGDLSLTKNWRINYNVMFDTEELKISYANLGITRNLHCWTMSINWTPIGPRQSYTFHIGVTANILGDLKLDKRSF